MPRTTEIIKILKLRGTQRLRRHFRQTTVEALSTRWLGEPVRLIKSKKIIVFSN